MTERDPLQLDLFTGDHGDQAAQRATPQRRSKPPGHAPAKEPSPSELPFDAERRIARDEINIVRFPVERWAPSLWRGKVGKTARLLQQRKTERGRENLWRSTVQTLFAQMQRRGATGEEIQRQIDDFHAAVAWSLTDQQSGPGAA